MRAHLTHLTDTWVKVFLKYRLVQGFSCNYHLKEQKECDLQIEDGSEKFPVSVYKALSANGEDSSKQLEVSPRSQETLFNHI